MGRWVRLSVCLPYSDQYVYLFDRLLFTGQSVRPLRCTSVSAYLSVYHSVGQCVHLFDCLLFIGSVCPPACLSSIKWVRVSAHHPLGKCVCPLSVYRSLHTVTLSPGTMAQSDRLSVRLPFSGSVCPPVCLSSSQCVSEYDSAHHPLGISACACLSVYHHWISVSTVYDCLPFSELVCPPFLTVYHLVGQCVHLYDCVPFNESVCPHLWLSTIQWVSVSTFMTVYHSMGQCVHLYDCLPFNGSVCPPFLTVFHLVGQCFHLFDCLSFSGSVQCVYPRLSVLHSVGQCICLSIIWYAVSARLFVYHSVGQCVHLFDCLLFSGSVCPSL